MCLFLSLFAVLLVPGGKALAGANGLLISKGRSTWPDSLASAVEFSEIRSFSTIHNFTTPAGEQRSVTPESVAAILFYSRMRAATFPNLMDANDMAAIQAAVDNLAALSARYPAAKRYLARYLDELRAEQARSRRGEGKFAGIWFPTLAAAQEARDGPLRQAAEERARQQALAQKEERRNLEAAAAAEQDERAKAQKFIASATALINRSAALEIWRAPPEDLSSVPQLPKDMIRDAEAAAAQYAALERELALPAPRRACAEASAGLKALLSWSGAAGAFAKLDALQGATSLEEYLAAHPRPEPKEIAPIWNQIQKLHQLCREKAKAAEERLRLAEKLLAEGKNAQAIIEYQVAHALFPDPRIPAHILSLRKESLGL